MKSDSNREWLETDGLGGFASGTVAGLRTRRYHALLLTATTPPTGRMVLVNGFDAWVETNGLRFDLSSQWYAPGVLGGDGAEHIESFESLPWPKWIYQCRGTRIQQEIFVTDKSPVTCVTWKLLSGGGAVRLTVRPFLSGRDYHQLHRRNPSFRFDAAIDEGRVDWQPYHDVPGVTALHNGIYRHDPHWYLNFSYQCEQSRGLDYEEDLAAPGTLSWQLDAGEAVLLLTPHHNAADHIAHSGVAGGMARLRQQEGDRRAQFTSRLHASADVYIVQKSITLGQAGKTVIAGYPWFTDWGRDTFIALRGLCIATGRLAEARDILIAWSSTVSEGMVPNRFPDHDGTPEFNSVDASLWYVNAVQEYLRALTARGKGGVPDNEDRQVLQEAVAKILDGYSKGTRFGIRVASDGLVAAGESGVQLTWMDAKVGDWVVTPRIGKPVEVQALWLNALAFAVTFDPRWHPLLELGLRNFRERFWNPHRGYLFDVVDVDRQAGVNDPSLRPNQLFAVGGLPLAILDGEQARQVVTAVETRLLTPLGLRSLAPEEPAYVGHYEGGVRQRDGAYHQGTVWPWLMGAFVEAWLRTHGNDACAHLQARRRFLEPMLAGMYLAGQGHISEIADGDPPHTPRGCPFQAWSVGEALRLDRVVLQSV